jgi:hypothetical protein
VPHGPDGCRGRSRGSARAISGSPGLAHIRGFGATRSTRCANLDRTAQPQHCVVRFLPPHEGVPPRRELAKVTSEPFATSAAARPCSNASRTASARNSGVYFRLAFPMDAFSLEHPVLPKVSVETGQDRFLDRVPHARWFPRIEIGKRRRSHGISRRRTAGFRPIGIKWMNPLQRTLIAAAEKPRSITESRRGSRCGSAAASSARSSLPSGLRTFQTDSRAVR